MRQTIAITFLFSFAFPLAAQNKLPTTFSKKIELVRSTVVQVMNPGIGSGTGFFVNSDGFVVTARHVVAGSNGEPVTKVLIELPYENVRPAKKGAPGVHMNGAFYGLDATVIDTDIDHDLALLKPVQNPLSKDFNVANAIVINNYRPKLRPRSAAEIDPRHLTDGEPIFISGYPLSIAVLVTTSGFIASSEAVDTDGNRWEDVYWADVQANHGNSGGPVFSLITCKVVGMQRAIAPAPVDFTDGMSGHSFGVAVDGKGQTSIHPIGSNSGLTEIIPASEIVDLLKKNHVSSVK